MTVAANLSPDDGFQMCRRRRPDAVQGQICAYPYNVFPIGPFALVRLATEAAGDSPVRQLYAARLLTLAFFAGAAVLAWLALARLLGDRRIALAAVLLAWSSYYLLYYGDMVSSEVPALFGVMLAFHGMVLFAQEGRFRQLALKTAAALLLGWQVVGLIAPFVLLGLAGELARARGRADGDPRPYARRALAAIARSPYLAYGPPRRAVLRAGAGLGRRQRARRERRRGAAGRTAGLRLAGRGAAGSPRWIRISTPSAGRGSCCSSSPPPAGRRSPSRSWTGWTSAWRSRTTPTGRRTRGSPPPAPPSSPPAPRGCASCPTARPGRPCCWPAGDRRSCSAARPPRTSTRRCYTSAPPWSSGRSPCSACAACSGGSARRARCPPPPSPRPPSSPSPPGT